MDLPDELELAFEEKVKTYEEVKQIPYISKIERRATQRGLEQGLEQGLKQRLEQGLRQKAREDIIDILTIRFGTVPPTLVERINGITESATLKRLLEQAGYD